MSALLSGKGSLLYHPDTGAVVGFLDAAGREQLLPGLSTPSPQTSVPWAPKVIVNRDQSGFAYVEATGDVELEPGGNQADGTVFRVAVRGVGAARSVTFKAGVVAIATGSGLAAPFVVAQNTNTVFGFLYDATPGMRRWLLVSAIAGYSGLANQPIVVPFAQQIVIPASVSDFASLAAGGDVAIDLDLDSGTTADGREMNVSVTASGGARQVYLPNATFSVPSGSDFVSPVALASGVELLATCIYRAHLARWQLVVAQQFAAAAGSGAATLALLSQTCDSVRYATLDMAVNGSLNITGTPVDSQQLTLLVRAGVVAKQLELPTSKFMLAAGATTPGTITIAATKAALVVMRWKAAASAWRLLNVTTGY